MDRLNEVRIPSMADDVATDLVTVFSRTPGSRKKRFARESLVVMQRLYQLTGANRPRGGHRPQTSIRSHDLRSNFWQL